MQDKQTLNELIKMRAAGEISAEELRAARASLTRSLTKQSTDHGNDGLVVSKPKLGITKRSAYVQIGFVIAAIAITSAWSYIQPGPTSRSIESNSTSTKPILKTIRLSNGEFGERWPFPDASSAVLKCYIHDHGPNAGNLRLRPIATVAVNGRTYGLNGAATGKLGFTDARAVLDRDNISGGFDLEGLSGLSEMLEKALTLCSGPDAVQMPVGMTLR